MYENQKACAECESNGGGVRAWRRYGLGVPADDIPFADCVECQTGCACVLMSSSIDIALHVC